MWNLYFYMCISRMFHPNTSGYNQFNISDRTICYWIYWQEDISVYTAIKKQVFRTRLYRCSQYQYVFQGTKDRNASSEIWTDCTQPRNVGVTETVVWHICSRHRVMVFGLHILMECVDTADIRKQYFNCPDLKTLINSVAGETILVFWQK